MKKIDGKEAIIEILKIGKEIYSQNEKIINSGIFGKNADIDILPTIDIDDIVAKLTGNTLTEKEAMGINEIYKNQDIANEYLAKEGDTPDWVGDIIFAYYDKEIELDKMIETLLDGYREEKY